MTPSLPAMLTVAHLTSVHPLGDTRILRKECRTLADAGYPVTLVVPTAEGGQRDGIRISAVPAPAGRLARARSTVRSVYRRALEIDADLYHLHDPELLPVGLLLRRRGKLVVYDAHEDLPRDILSKDWLPVPVRRPLALVTERVESACARRMSAVVTATPAIAERFEALNPRTRAVNNYPIIGDLSAPSRPLAERERAVCYVGDINAVRGTIEMIDAAELAGVKLLLGGTFSEVGLHERALARPGWSRVEELGQIGKSDVTATFARARAGLVLLHPAPNHVTGRPNKLFEYMSAGLPVIASNFPLWRSFVEENGCGLCVDPLDTDAIADAIGRLVDDPAAGEEMGRRGREAVENHYSWDTQARRLLDLYAELTPTEII